MSLPELPAIDTTIRSFASLEEAIADLQSTVVTIKTDLLTLHSSLLLVIQAINGQKKTPELKS